MKMLIAGSNKMTSSAPARGRGISDWQRWAPYAVVTWSLFYAALGVFWLAGGGGFPYADSVSDVMHPLVTRLGSDGAWVIVLMLGIPAVGVGIAMLRGVRGRALRPMLIATGLLLAGILLVLMTGLDLLVKVGYIPAAVLGLLTAEKSQAYLAGLIQWSTIHQLLCLSGGFLWLAATLCYARRSADACPYCGRRVDREGWISPERAARWGRIALYVAMATPVIYALTRYAWALGVPLGISIEHLRQGQEEGVWIGGLSLANFGLVGALLMLGLVQRWGEVFPRWMIGLSGRRVPIALAVIPASLASVLLLVGGIGIWSNLAQMVANAAAAGAEGTGLLGELTFVVGPTLLFPIWGVALAVATLGYYYRRRGRCGACGQGTPEGGSDPLAD